MPIRFEVEGVELLNQRLSGLAASLTDLRRYFPEVVREFENIQNQWYSSRGNGTWPPLSARYAAWKETHFPGQPLLVLTGNLQSSQFFTEMTNKSVVITTSPPDYWIYHQFGTSKMPARPPYVVDRDTAQTLGEKLADAIMRHLRSV